MRKVVFVSCCDHVAGAERSMLLLASHLKDFGWHPIIFCPVGGLEEAALSQNIDVQVIDWKMIPLITEKSIVSAVIGTVLVSLRNSFKLARQLRKSSANLVVSNTLQAHPWTLLGGFFARSKVVWHVRDLGRSDSGKTVFVWAAGLTDAVIAISHVVAKSIPGSKTSVIYNPIENGEQKPTLAARSRVVGYVGRIDEGKGIETLIEAVGMLPETELLIAGRVRLSSDSYQERLYSLADKVAPGRVRWLGEIDGPEELLSSVAVLGVPSLREPFGRVAAESLAAGVPVVASNSGGLPEIIDDGVNGFLFEPGNAADMASKIASILDSEELATRFSIAGIASAKKYDPKEHASKVSQLFNKVCD